MALEFFQFPYLEDNYGVLIHDQASGETACVDAGEPEAVLAALKSTGWTLTQLWITHHHWDHTDGLLAVKKATGAHVFGPKYKGVEKLGAEGSETREIEIDGLDTRLAEGDTFSFAGHDVQILHTPGHTMDMINFYIPTENTVFTGDTLFVMGCGRLFEGSPELMWNGMQKLMKLPSETVVYCAHEYTSGNASFALTVDPQNAALKSRVADVAALRAENKPTVPTTLAQELATNPFLRPADPSIRAHLGMEHASDAEVFTEIRLRKDNA